MDGQDEKDWLSGCVVDGYGKHDLRLIDFKAREVGSRIDRNGREGAANGRNRITILDGGFKCR